jgi:hypothetical protein
MILLHWVRGTPQPNRKYVTLESVGAQIHLLLMIVDHIPLAEGALLRGVLEITLVSRQPTATVVRGKVSSQYQARNAHSHLLNLAKSVRKQE